MNLLERLATVLEMINSRKIDVSMLQSRFQRIDTIDATRLGNS